MSNGLLNTSTGLEPTALRVFFSSTRYWRHCVPDALTYLAKLNRLELTGHPASLRIFHFVSALSFNTYQQTALCSHRSELSSETEQDRLRFWGFLFSSSCRSFVQNHHQAALFKTKVDLVKLSELFSFKFSFFKSSGDSALIPSKERYLSIPYCALFYSIMITHRRWPWARE